MEKMVKGEKGKARECVREEGILNTLNTYTCAVVNTRESEKKIERGKKIYYRSGIADAKKGGGRMSFGDKGQQGETDKQTDEQKNYSDRVTDRPIDKQTVKRTVEQTYSAGTETN